MPLATIRLRASRVLRAYTFYMLSCFRRDEPRIARAYTEAGLGKPVAKLSCVYLIVAFTLYGWSPRQFVYTLSLATYSMASAWLRHRPALRASAAFCAGALHSTAARS